MAVQTVRAQVRELKRALGHAMHSLAGRGLRRSDAGRAPRCQRPDARGRTCGLQGAGFIRSNFALQRLPARKLGVVALHRRTVEIPDDAFAQVKRR